MADRRTCADRLGGSGRARGALAVDLRGRPTHRGPSGRRAPGRPRTRLGALRACAPAGSRRARGGLPGDLGQPSGWRQRASLGALGYWWLTLRSRCLGVGCGWPAGRRARGLGGAARASCRGRHRSRCSRSAFCSERCCGPRGRSFFRGSYAGEARCWTRSPQPRGRALLFAATPALDHGLSAHGPPSPAPDGACSAPSSAPLRWQSQRARCAGPSDVGFRSMAQTPSAAADRPPMNPLKSPRDHTCEPRGGCLRAHLPQRGARRSSSRASSRREMDEHRTVSVSRVYGPNEYARSGSLRRTAHAMTALRAR